MSRDTHQPLRQLAAATSTQLDVLLDGAARPDVDLSGLRHTSLDMLLAAIDAALVSQLDAADLDADARAHYTQVHEQLERWQALSRDVAHHLLDLADQWRCSSCGSDVPGGAAISGLRAKALTVSLVCEACTARTPITVTGNRAFRRYFGALVGPAWIPTANGFAWDGS